MTEQTPVNEQGPAPFTESPPTDQPAPVTDQAPVTQPETPAQPAAYQPDQPAPTVQRDPLLEGAKAMDGTPDVDAGALADQLRALGYGVTPPADQPTEEQEQRAGDSPTCDNCGSVQLSIHQGDATTPGFEGKTFMRCLTCGNTQEATPAQLGEGQ